MATRDDDFTFLLAAVRRLLDEIRAEVAPRREGHKRGVVLAEHVVQTLDAIAARVEGEEQRYAHRVRPASKAGGSRELRFYAQLVWATHDALRWLRPDPDVLDLGALYFADEAALALLGQGIEIVPVEAPEYMYSTSSWPFQWVFEQHLKEPMPKADRPIVLAFPAHERHTMLLHCLFVHELGHASVDDHDLVEAVLQPIKGTAPYQAALQQTFAASGPASTATIAADPEGLAESWIEELLCDALAFTYLGPAYLFAFAEMGLSVSWSEPGNDHPSTTHRTSLLVDLADDQGWSAYLEARVSPIWEWLKFAATTNPGPRDAVSSFAEQVCQQARANILSAPQTVLGNHAFMAQEWKDDEKHFTDLLTNDVLPAEQEDGSPAEHAQILLAAWLQAIEKHGNRPAAISASIGETDYHRFVARALEMSTMLRVWKEAETDPAEA